METANAKVTTGIAIMLALAVVATFFFFMSENNQGAPLGTAPGSSAGAALATALEAFSPADISGETGLITEDVTVGNGLEAAVGDTVTVAYVGALATGEIFDASRGEPFVFTLGAGKVIEGWEQGILGMREGGTRVLVIPPNLAYGELDLGIIPPNSVLLFEVELVKVDKPSR